jgi:D-arabinose 1-dehydrogenase-like Zn-dependent alcohol dehydrogenase
MSSLFRGAKIILGTASSENAMTSVLGGMAVNGKIIMIGAFDESLELTLLPFYPIL